MKLLRTLRYVALILAATASLAWTAERAMGIGFVLRETKEELKLDYDVSVKDHGTDRVTVVFTLADAGRIKPLDEVQLIILSREENEHGGHGVDLVVSIDMVKTDGGKRVGRIHIRRELAERAEIWLNTHTMDGKSEPLTGLHHVIPIARYMHRSPAPGAVAEPAAPPPLQPAGPPATEGQEN